MTRIELPFLPEFRALVRSGRKTTTVRTRNYGKQGDTFLVEDALFVLMRVEQMPLARARDHYYHAEGFETPEAFEASWARLHPQRGFRESDAVWAHHFRPAGP